MRFLLDAPVPAPVLQSLRADKRIEQIAKTIARDLLSPSPSQPGNIKRQFQDLRLYDNSYQRLARCGDLLLTPNSMDWSSEAGGGTNRISGLGKRLKRLGSKYLFGQDR